MEDFLGWRRRVALISCNGFNMEVDEVCNPSALVGFDGVAGVSKVQHKRATTEAPVFQYLVLPQVQNLRKVTTIISWLSRKKDNLVQLKKLLGGGGRGTLDVQWNPAL